MHHLITRICATYPTDILRQRAQLEILSFAGKILFRCCQECLKAKTSLSSSCPPSSTTPPSSILNNRVLEKDICRTSSNSQRNAQAAEKISEEREEKRKKTGLIPFSFPRKTLEERYRF